MADPASHVVFPDGTYLTHWMDIDRTCEEISKFSRRDTETYRTMISEWRAVAPFFNKVRYTPAGWTSAAEQLASYSQSSIWLRRQALSAWDIITSSFEDWRNHSSRRLSHWRAGTECGYGSAQRFGTKLQ